jgi:F-type H+-transporting ATPase subunit delta
VSTETTGATGLAGRYAKALYEIAEQGREVDGVADDLRALRAMIAASDDLTRLIRSPVIPADDQARAVDAVLEAAQSSPLTRKFIGVVAQNRRLFALTDMIEAFLEMLAFHRGEVAADVTSATALDDRQLNAIGDTLKRVLGGTVSINATVDPAIIGGLVVRVGSRMIDSSLATKLQHLRLAIRGAG